MLKKASNPELMSQSDSRAVSKKCTATTCGKVDVTEFPTCRFCGQSYKQTRPWQGEKQGSEFGGFLRDPVKVLLAMVVVGGIYYGITKHNPLNVLGDTIGAVIKGGTKIELESISETTSILQQHPENVEARIKRADAYQAVLNSKAALSDYNIAIELDPQPAFYKKRAIAYDALGEYQKAAADESAARKLTH
jgi:hypothetical protein